MGEGKPIKLSAKHARFVQEYMIDLNATQAARRAGYSPKTARAQGSALLTNPVIQAAIAARQEKRAQRLEVTADRVLEELALIAFADISDAVRVCDDGTIQVRPLDSISPQARRAIGELTQTTTERHDPQGVLIEKVRLGVKHHSKVKALELLMGHLGMNAPQKVEHSGEVELVSAKARLSGKLDELRKRHTGGGDEPSGNAGA